MLLLTLLIGMMAGLVQANNQPNIVVFNGRSRPIGSSDVQIDRCSDTSYATNG
ncbi:MAG: hypothetical protein ACK517_02330 [bacterium]